MKRVSDAMEFSHNAIAVRLDRPPRVTDAQIILSDRNPRWFERGSRLLDSTESDDAFARALYDEKTTEQLEAILDGPFLLLRDGQIIHEILMARAFGSSDAGTPETLLQRSA